MNYKLQLHTRLIGLLILTVCLLTSCGDDEYYYPSVKMEFLTAQSGADGNIQFVLTDEGGTLPVLEDLSRIHIDANSSLRIVSNYGRVEAADGTVGAKLYASLSTVSPLPQTADEFKGGVKTDPADVQSIWMGRNYLNMILNIKTQNGKHMLHFVEEEVVADTETGHTMVRLLLYHDAGGGVQAYTKRAYLSVPLQQYATEGVKTVTVYFNVHTYGGSVKTYQLDYIPNSN